MYVCIYIVLRGCMLCMSYIACIYACLNSDCYRRPVSVSIGDTHGLYILATRTSHKFKQIKLCMWEMDRNK